jgi:hypothetical protein
MTSQQMTRPLLVAQRVYEDVIGDNQSISSFGGADIFVYHWPGLSDEVDGDGDKENGDLAGRGARILQAFSKL